VLLARHLEMLILMLVPMLILMLIQGLSPPS
jgi:hypothetical protein